MLVYRQTASATHTTVSRANNSAPVGPFAPCQFALFGRLSQDLECIQPLHLAISRDADGAFVTGDNVFHMYGIGDTVGESIGDYVAVLTEYYQHLAVDDDEPSRALFEYLQTFIRLG